MSTPKSASGPTEGYVRFQAQWTETGPPRHDRLSELDSLRTRLWDRGWIGATPEGVGFGNLSLRDHGSTFIITGTATGADRVLGPRGYTLVTAVHRSRNTVVCQGPVRASAETMSHAAIYEAHPRVTCVIHIHSGDLWRRGLELNWPATPVQAEYGTPGLADAIAALVRARDRPRGTLVLAGHQDGILSFGRDPRDAEEELLAVRRLAQPG